MLCPVAYRFQAIRGRGCICAYFEETVNTFFIFENNCDMGFNAFYIVPCMGIIVYGNLISQHPHRLELISNLQS